MTDIHLCNTYRQMLMALSDIMAGGEPATVIYLQDYLPIGVAGQRRLQEICTHVDFIYTSDIKELQAFRQLPRWVPEILSRNIRFTRYGMPLRPHEWRPDYLKGRRFSTGYVYHSGFFMSKIVAGISDEVVLREDGYTNYTPHDVPSLLKRLLRWFHGLPPGVQVFGEEPWITRIEMSSPERLPPNIRHKARELLFDDLMMAIPAEAAQRLAATFAPSLASFDDNQSRQKTALLLTPPIDIVGMCTVGRKTEIYQHIADWLLAHDCRVFVKNHPREPAFELQRTITVPGSFPIEAWPFMTPVKFDVGIALCTSALLDNKLSFVKSGVQLVTSDTFFAHATDSWPAQISANLEKLEEILKGDARGAGAAAGSGG